jgi:hypothetical protein
MRSASTPQRVGQGSSLTPSTTVPIPEGLTRETYTVNGLERCLPCALRGIEREVVFAKGRPTALCRSHTDYEVELRRRLIQAEKDAGGKLTAEKAKEIRSKLREEARAKLAAERAEALLPHDEEDDEP